MIVLEILLKFLFLCLAFLMFFAGLLLHKLGTIRKWEIEEEKKDV